MEKQNTRHKSFPRGNEICGGKNDTIRSMEAKAKVVDKPFDVLSKMLIAAHPQDWLALIGVTDTGATPVEVVDADLATLVQQADRVPLRGGDVPELFNLEIETGRQKLRFA